MRNFPSTPVARTPLSPRAGFLLATRPSLLGTLGVGGYLDASSHSVDYGKEHYTCFQFPYDWRRDNHDGYGQKPDGSAFDGTGEGRCWPILTGERAHYELAAGRDPKPYIEAMENFANVGGMMPEQVWDADDCGLRNKSLTRLLPWKS